MSKASAEPFVVFLGFEVRGLISGSACNDCSCAYFVPPTPTVGAVVISTHTEVDTVVCSELCLGRRLVQLGRMEFVHGELEQLGRGWVLGNESDELLVLLLPDLSGLRQH